VQPATVQPVRHRQGPGAVHYRPSTRVSADGADRRGVPSRWRPLSSSQSAITTPMVSAESATLKTGKTLPSGAKTLIMSTTRPPEEPVQQVTGRSGGQQP